MSEVPTKTCIQCGETKPRTEFHKNTAKGDGFHSSCKACRIKMTQASHARRRSRQTPAQHAAFLAKRRLKYAKQMEAKPLSGPILCLSCRLYKPRSEYWKNGSANGKQQYYRRCKDCAESPRDLKKRKEMDHGSDQNRKEE